MNSQKAENLLNLSRDATQTEKDKSAALSVGYDRQSKQWELIIKYSGSLEPVEQLAQRVIRLQNEYAIIVIDESKIDRLLELPEIEYIEKPKSLYFQITNGRRASCIDELQEARFDLRGKGVIIAVLDSGIDYTLPVFRNKDGTTKILNLWDQSIQYKTSSQISSTGEMISGAADVYGVGADFTQKEIDEALAKSSYAERREAVPSFDYTGHGTTVAGIAAGIAPDSDLLIVKLGNAQENGFPRTTQLMMGLDYVIRKSAEYRKPVAVNISFGNTYGSHNGTSLLERYIDDMSNIWKNVICIGTGNEAASAGHASGTLKEGKEEKIELAVQENQPSFNLQIWKTYSDEADISLVSPAGKRVGPISETLGTQRFVVQETEILLYYGEPSPYSTSQEIFIDFIPKNDYVNAGRWAILLTPKRVVAGIYELWLPSESALNKGTAFLYPTSSTTLTIPSTAQRGISVGAYDARTFAYAVFSGRGREGVRRCRELKPDIAAPGVNVIGYEPGGTRGVFSGTSFAVPFVTAGCALMMEWGIVRNNDPYLYGEKVKAYLHRGARELPGYGIYPNNEVGWGALCIRGSLPI